MVRLLLTDLRQWGIPPIVVIGIDVGFLAMSDDIQSHDMEIQEFLWGNRLLVQGLNGCIISPNAVLRSELQFLRPAKPSQLIQLV